eukprot:TRINITY_DN25279_c0_g1_i1.p1 TRINITY_DN25279_c0_g1~~TRINITY_DN25279_c0_g1_i1.p1  ORF type:complete len:153 (+),score=10.47 TRINITY_DN25279_c0_g1_i1:92-550(+)
MSLIRAGLGRLFLQRSVVTKFDISSFRTAKVWTIPGNDGSEALKAGAFAECLFYGRLFPVWITRELRGQRVATKSLEGNENDMDPNALVFVFDQYHPAPPPSPPEAPGFHVEQFALEGADHKVVDGVPMGAKLRFVEIDCFKAGSEALLETV